MNQKPRGSNFDDFLMEEGIYAEMQALAVKKLFALKLAELRKSHLRLGTYTPGRVGGRGAKWLKRQVELIGIEPTTS